MQQERYYYFWLKNNTSAHLNLKILHERNIKGTRGGEMRREREEQSKEDRFFIPSFYEDDLWQAKSPSYIPLAFLFCINLS